MIALLGVMVTASRRRDADSSHIGCRSARRLELVLDAVDNTAVVVDSIDNVNKNNQRSHSYVAKLMQVPQRCAMCCIN